jgi:hypothetical protein
MVTIKCSQCGQELAVKFKKCFKCGAEIIPPPGSEPKKAAIGEENPGKLRKKPKGLTRFYAIFLIGLIIITALIVREMSNTSDRVPKISARELYFRYYLNQASADKTFKGKFITISGEVTSVSDNLPDSTAVSLLGGNYDFEAVMCFFPKNTEGLKHLAKGQKLTATCKVDSYVAIIPVLNQCSFY